MEEALDLYRYEMPEDGFEGKSKKDSLYERVTHRDGNVTYVDFGKKKVMDKLYGRGINHMMYLDPSVEIVNDDSVDGDGNIGYCFFDTGKKLVANFRNYMSKYTGKIAKWMDYIRNLTMSAVYDHELDEHEDQDRTNHGVVMSRGIKNTKDFVRKLAKYAMVEIGLWTGNEQAEEAARVSDIRDEIKEFKRNKEIRDKYITIRDSIANMNEISPPPEYAYATVRSD